TWICHTTPCGSVFEEGGKPLAESSATSSPYQQALALLLPMSILGENRHSLWPAHH
ncbi:hypothetical protein DSO57_1023469, partial [Entomophthora muscae]